MAWGSGVTLNTRKLTMAFNRMLTERTTSVIMQTCGMLFALQNKEFPNAMPPGLVKFSSSTNITGVKLEWRLHGVEKSLEVLVTPADEMAAPAPVHNDNIWANAELVVPFLYADFPVLQSELEKLKGSPAKTSSYMEEIAKHMEISWQRGINKKLVALAPGAGDIFSIPAIVDDANTYAGINRAAAGNEPFQAEVKDLGSVPINIKDIYEMQTRCSKWGAWPRIIFCASALYNSLYWQAAAYNHVNQSDPMWVKFGGKFFSTNTATFVLEPDLDATTIIGIDPTNWIPVFNEGGNLFRSSFIPPEENSASKTAGLLKTTAFIQPVSLQPHDNFKIKNALP